MKILDRILRRWRYRVATPHIPRGSVLLDIGGDDGSFLELVSSRIEKGFVLDPLCADRMEGRFQFLKGNACSRIPLPDASVDVITLLAVLEHVPDVNRLAGECFRVLKKGGRVIATVPHPAVDHILRILIGFRLADGIAAEEHHDFDVRRVVPLFNRHGFNLVRHETFQLGLNNFFVFKKCPATKSGNREVGRKDILVLENVRGLFPGFLKAVNPKPFETRQMRLGAIRQKNAPSWG